MLGVVRFLFHEHKGSCVHALRIEIFLFFYPIDVEAQRTALRSVLDVLEYGGFKIQIERCASGV